MKINFVLITLAVLLLSSLSIAQAQEEHHIDSCQNLSGISGTYSLNQSIDLSASPGVACINVTDSATFTIDCAGYDLVGYGDAIGILLDNTTNVVVENCGNISNWTQGVRTNTGADVIYRNNTVFDVDYGLYFNNVTDANATNNIVTATTDGIDFVGGSNNSIAYDNIVNGGDSGSGVYIDDSENVTIDDNTVTNSQFGILDNANFYTDIINNNVSDCDYAIRPGGGLVNWINTYIAHNTITDSSNGIFVLYNGFDENMTIYNNTIYDMRSNTQAIFVTNDHQNVTSNNISLDDTGDGIRIYRCNSCFIEDNTVDGNDLGSGNDGIFNSDSSVGSMDPVIRRNTVTDFYYGIYVVSNVVTGLDIDDNDVTSCYAGIYVKNMLNGETTVENNYVANNAGFAGLWIEASDGAVVDNNTAKYNNIGMYVQESDDTNVTNNVFDHSTNYGMYYSGAGSSVGGHNINNTATNNGGTGIGLQAYNLVVEGNNVTMNSNGFDLNGQNCNLSGNRAWDNDNYGITIWGDNAIIVGDEYSTNNLYDVWTRTGSDNSIFHDINLGNNKVISFSYDGNTQWKLKAGTSPGGEPDNHLSKDIVLINETAMGWFFVNLSYTDSEVNALNMSEPDLHFGKYDTSWQTNTSEFSDAYGVNTVDNYVYANLTTLSTFDIFGPVILTDCAVLNTPGNYILNQTVYGVGVVPNYCMQITTDGVAIDCRGNTLDGNIAYPGCHGIYGSGGNDFNVTNCTIREYYYGITMKGQNHDISHNEFHSIQNNYAMWFNTVAGGEINVYNNLVNSQSVYMNGAGVNFYNNTLSPGLTDSCIDWYSASGDNHVYNNSFLACRYGIRLDNSAGGITSSIQDNTFRNIEYVPIWVSSNYDNDCDTNVTGNVDYWGTPIYFVNEDSTTIEDGTAMQIEVCNADNVVIDNMTVDGPWVSSGGVYGLSGGIIVLNSENVTINNSVSNGTDIGINLIHLTGNNIVKNTQIHFTDRYGIDTSNTESLVIDNVTIGDLSAFGNQGIDIEGQSSGPVNVTNSHIYDTTSVGIYNTQVPNCNFINNTIHDADDLAIYNAQNANMINNTIYNTHNGGIWITHYNGLSKSIVANNTIYNIHQQQQAQSRLDNHFGIRLDGITNDSVVYGNTIYDMGGFGIFIGRDCQGDSEGCDQSNGYMDVYNNTINNTDETGIFIVSETDVDVYDNLIHGSNMSGVEVGHYYRQGQQQQSFCDIYNNEIYDTKYGISLNGTSRETVNNNIIYDIVQYGVYVNGVGHLQQQQQQSDNVVEYNNIANVTGDGIFVEDSDNETVRHNIIYNVTDAGIEYDNTTVSMIWNNSITLANIGFDISQVNDTTITENIISTIQNQMFSLNHVDNLTVSDNNGTNSTYGISSTYLTNSEISGNVFSNLGNHVITLSSDSSDVNIINNVLTNGSQAGILIYDENSTISGNNITGMNYGIWVYDATNCTFEDNNIYDSTEGIQLSGSTNHDFANNYIYNCSSWDIDSLTSSDITFVNMTLNDTTVDFTYDGRVTVSDIDALSPPTGYHGVGHDLDIRNLTAAWMDITYHYTDLEVSNAGITEDNLILAKHDGTAWETNTSLFATGLSLDNITNTYTANITNFGSTFSLMGETSIGQVTPGGNWWIDDIKKEIDPSEQKTMIYKVATTDEFKGPLEFAGNDYVTILPGNPTNSVFSTESPSDFERVDIDPNNFGADATIYFKLDKVKLGDNLAAIKIWEYSDGSGSESWNELDYSLDSQDSNFFYVHSETVPPLGVYTATVEQPLSINMIILISGGFLIMGMLIVSLRSRRVLL